jgi:hypothetical protein
MLPSASAAVLAAIDHMGGTLAVARALAESGRRIDLAGLDRDIAALCVALMALDEGQARPMRGALEALVRELDALVVALTP